MKNACCVYMPPEWIPYHDMADAAPCDSHGGATQIREPTSTLSSKHHCHLTETCGWL